MPTILLISGSPSGASKSAALLEYARSWLAAENIDTHLVSVRDFPPADLILGRYESQAFDEFKQRVERADGLVVATPIYKAAYSGSLKTLLDILPYAALRGKTVLPVATGGSAAHLLAIDYALKPVLSALGATDLLQGVYAVDKELVTDANGQLAVPDELAQRFRAAVAQLAATVKIRAALV